MRYPPSVTVVEVGPRDGLQNEAAAVSTADKVAFVDRLSDAGCPVIEVTAFVSPKWVPQMADAAEVFAGIAQAARHPLHRAGAEPRRARARPGGGCRRGRDFRRRVRDVQPAQHQPDDRRIAGGLPRGLRARGSRPASASAAICRPRSAVRSKAPLPPARVVELSEALIAMGAFEVAVSDTIGIAHPGQVVEVVGASGARVPLDRIALHFHDTRGTALANVLAALDLGVATFDASAGGLGGCPYAPGAAGNLATEDLDLHAGRPRHRDRRGSRAGGRRLTLHRVQDRTRPSLALRPGSEGRSW